MSILPQTTSLGILEILEVYEYCDIPRLFSCKNNVGQIFITTWIEENTDYQEWLYVPVSESRLKDLKFRIINLQDIFRNSETKFVHKITISKIDNNSTVEDIFSSTIGMQLLQNANNIIEKYSKTKSRYSESLFNYEYFNNKSIFFQSTRSNNIENKHNFVPSKENRVDYFFIEYINQISTNINDDTIRYILFGLAERYLFHLKSAQIINHRNECWNEFLSKCIPIFSLILTFLAGIIEDLVTVKFSVLGMGFSLAFVIPLLSLVITALSILASVLKPYERYIYSSDLLIKLNDWKVNFVKELTKEERSHQDTLIFLEKKNQDITAIGEQILNNLIVSSNESQ